MKQRTSTSTTTSSPLSTSSYNKANRNNVHLYFSTCCLLALVIQTIHKQTSCTLSITEESLSTAVMTNLMTTTSMQKQQQQQQQQQVSSTGVGGDTQEGDQVVDDVRHPAAASTTTNTTTTTTTTPFSCRDFLKDAGDDKDDDGQWVPVSSTVNNQNVTTSTTKSTFLMNIHHPTKDVHVSGSLAIRGCFECDILYSAMTALHQHKDSLLIDIGGNIGLYSLYASFLGHDAYIFEPVQKNYARICRSILKNTDQNGNGFEQRIKLFANAVTAQPTIVEFSSQREVGQNLGSYTMRETKKAAPPVDSRRTTSTTSSQLSSSGNTIEGIDYAKGIRLDSIRHLLVGSRSLSQTTNRPVVLKVDVEGYECIALQSGLDWLRELNIVYVAIEWSYSRLKDHCDARQDIFDLFTSKGLKPYMRLGNNNDNGKWELLDINTWQYKWKQRGGRFPNIGLYDIAWSKESPANYYIATPPSPKRQ